MHELADRLTGLVSDPDALEREFEALLVDSSTLAFRVAYGVLRQREDAEDVAQEAFVRAHRKLHQLRDRTRFRAWLVRMTWRLAIDRLRTDRRRLAREHAHVDSVEGAGGTPQPDLSLRVWSAIDALPEKLRVTVVLSGIEGHDTRQVAALLGIPEGTVKSRLFLARQQMKEMLK